MGGEKGVDRKGFEVPRGKARECVQGGPARQVVPAQDDRPAPWGQV